MIYRNRSNDVEIWLGTYIEILMPCPFTCPKMFWAGPNFLRQTKNLFTYWGSHKHFLTDKKMICIQLNCFFCTSTKCFEEALIAVKILSWLKKFGPAQNILGPVKGQGICFLTWIVSSLIFQNSIYRIWIPYLVFTHVSRYRPWISLHGNVNQKN